jgi:hypothetical protein
MAKYSNKAKSVYPLFQVPFESGGFEHWGSGNLTMGLQIWDQLNWT